jgi:phosphoglycolate phosphatase-like HAD superfamily hydrolase
VSFRALLFDIDGTLVHCGGAGRRAIERAMERHFGEAIRPKETWLGELKLDGMTDRLIVREAMTALGLRFDDATCDAVLATYVEHLRDEIRGPGYEVLPGVEAALAAGHAAGAVVGLCTGNVRPGAAVKLARGGLDRFYERGDDAPNGFAGDGEAREDIVAAVLRRCAARLGRALDPREAVVIGDTPRDILAARAWHVPVLAVATGRFTVDTLRALGADRVVPSLDDPEARRFLLG